MRRRLKVRVRDSGEVLDARDAMDLVNKLAGSSRSPSAPKQWMRETAARARQQSNRPVRHDTARHFVTDLCDAGLLRRLRH